MTPPDADWRRIGASDSDCGRIGVSAVSLLVVRSLLLTVGYRSTARVVARIPAFGTYLNGGSPEPKRIADAIEEAASRMPFHIPCLTKALTCKALLGQYDIDTRLHVGVTKTDESLTAHAWVTHRNEILLGDTADNPTRYQQFSPRFEP